METQETLDSWNSLGKVKIKKASSITLLISNYTTKTQMSKEYVHKSGQIDQWNKIESPEKNLWLYYQIICDKECKNIQ